MGAITIQPKPGLWAANAAAVDPYWREYWQDLFVFLPYQGIPGNAVDLAPMAFHNPSNTWDVTAVLDLPRWQGAVTDADWVLGQVGVGLKGSLTIGVDDGVKVGNRGAQWRLNGKSRPIAFAILFEYDGLDTGDQRALVSQGTFRMRISTGTSPFSLEGTVPAITNAIYANELTLVVVWSNPKNTASADYDMLCFNLQDRPDARQFAFDTDLAGISDVNDALFVGSQVSNDPSEGLTVYGFWAWGAVAGKAGSTAETENQWWDQAKAEKFAEDPFGMYRRAAVAELSPIAQVGTVQEGGVGNSGTVTLTFDVPPIEDDLVVVVGSIGNSDGNGPKGPLAASDYIERAHDATLGATNPNIGMWTKRMTATPDTDVVMQTENGSDGVVYQSIVLRGVDKDNPMDAAPVVTVTSTPDNPDLDPITTVTDGAWVILAFGGSPDSSTMTAFPTGYVGFHEHFGETNDGNVAIATKEVVTAGVENPDAATALWGSGHASITAAFRPTRTDHITLVGTPQIGTAQDGGNVTLTFDEAPLEDDIVLLVGGHGNETGSAAIGPSTAGYATEEDVDDGADDWTSGIWTKPMTSTPDTNVVCLGSGNANDATVYVAWVLRGVDTANILDVTSVLTARVTTDDPDPGSITPITDDAWVIIVSHTSKDDLATAYPAGYDQTLTAGRIDSNRQGMAAAKKAMPKAVAEDPGAFIQTTNALANAAWTIAIRPAGGPGDATATPSSVAAVVTMPAVTAVATIDGAIIIQNA